MSITDELREWGDRWEDTIALEIKEIADRIDERYHRNMATAQQVGINEGEDAAMREGWVKSPVDADGVPVRVGDVMEWSDGETFEVVGIGGGTLFYIKHDFDNSAQWTAAHDKRHRKPDSWERILDDAAKLSRGDNGAVMELVERCRRLAGEDA